MHAKARRAAAYLLSATLLAALGLALLTAIQAEASIHREVHINYTIAVVIYGDGILASLDGKQLIHHVDARLGEWRLRYTFRVLHVEAPRWAVEQLEEWLQRHSVPSPLPPWARGCPGVGGGEVHRVNLVEYYSFLNNLTSRVIRERGLSSRWSIAIVALPGARLLWAEAPYPWVDRRLLSLEGARLYTGWSRFTLYDLYALQARHPSYPMPFSSYTPPVDCFREPLLPALEDPAAHVEETVRMLLETQLANFLEDAEPWYSRKLVVDIYVVDYGGSLGGLLSSLDLGEAERLLRLLDPWVRPATRLHVVEPGDAPWGRLNLTRDREGHVVADLDRNPGLVRVLREKSRREACRGAMDVCRVSFYWLLLPGEAYMTLGWRLNFTGLDLGAAAVATYPGYHGRVLRGGASRTVAHEAGHAMGLPHPFQKGLSIHWGLDYAYTVMSYCDSILAAAPWNATMIVDADKLALLHTLALLDNASDPRLQASALELLQQGMFDKALEALEGGRGVAGEMVAACICPREWETLLLLVVILIALVVALSMAAAAPVIDEKGRRRNGIY